MDYIQCLWRDQHARLVWIDCIIWYAGCIGNLEILECVDKIRKDIFNVSYGHDYTEADKASVYIRSGLNLMNEVVTRGLVDIAQWLLDHEHPFCSDEAMDEAAGNGHLEIVKWLHGNRGEGCTTKAMDQAARNGHLEVIQWLHENRTEGCTTSAMDWACLNGYMIVLQFLHTYCTEGCTNSAMANAAKNDHLDVVKWLLEHRSGGCSDHALQSKHCKVLEFLALHTTFFRLDQIIERLAECNHFGTIDSILRETQAKELAHAKSSGLDP